ncbi:MAG: hypothetical protein RAP70_05660 [Candidatus Celaenobacter antarcticus]|nr:hypothetical protein [Candidatus Celaenobacter antarcticus]
MKKNTFTIYLVITGLLIIITGCAITPSVQIWQPWTRILESNYSIPLNSKVKIVVEGETKPLLGDDVFLQNDIKEKLKYLLERRGYNIVSDNSQFTLILKYKTERHDKLNSSSLIYSSTDNASALLSTSGSLTSLGLGVSIAQTISAISNKSNVMSQNITETVKSYAHTISIEIFNDGNELVWQGESSWDSSNINLQTEIQPSIQLIISNLPENEENLPFVSQVKNGKENNYYNLICEDRWFSCPALPYRITFSSRESIDNNIPMSIKDPNALPSYIDLIQTAEYALPLGLKDYSNPLNKSLWSKVQLGGKYKLSSNKQQKILIILKGEKSGYLVDKCWIASDEEFSEFENHLNKWRNSLIDYYDIYKE